MTEPVPDGPAPPDGAEASRFRAEAARTGLTIPRPRSLRIGVTAAIAVAIAAAAIGIGWAANDLNPSAPTTCATPVDRYSGSLACSP